MSQTVTLNGVPYTIPSPGESHAWGPALNAYLVALAAAINAGGAAVSSIAVKTTTLTIGASDEERVNFNSIEADEEDQITVGASWAFAARDDGLYRVNAAVCLEFEAEGDVEVNLTLKLYKNGDEVRRASWVETADTLSRASFALSCELVLESDDELYLAIDNGGGEDISIPADAGTFNYISICKG